MAHFAELDENNIVLRVITIRNEDIIDENGQESEALGVEMCRQVCGPNTNWKQTSYNKNFRNKYAGIGDWYNSELNVFMDPKPYPSWSLDTETFFWVPPIPMPNDDLSYEWNEETTSWDVVPFGNID